MCTTPSSRCRCRCKWDIISSKTSFYVNKLFKMFGDRIYHKPCLFISIGVFITFLCSLGLINFERVPDTGKLYSLNNNHLYVEYDIKKQYFAEHTNLLLLVEVNDDINIDDSIYDRIYDSIYDINVTYNQQIYGYQDVCVQNSNVNSTECQSDLEQWHRATNVLLITYSLHQYNDSDIYSSIQYEFQEAFKMYWLANKNKYESINVYFYTDRNLTEEQNSIIARNAPVMGIAFILMLLYLIFALSDYSEIKIHFRLWLALSSIISLLFSMIMAFGLGAMCGYKANSMVFMIPFLLLGIGVDDDIVIMDYYHQIRREMHAFKPSEIHSMALSRSGLSITVTSLCTVSALLVGLFSNIDGIISFCIHAVFAFFANYVLQFLLFYAFLVYDEKRIEQRRNCCLPCIRHGPHSNVSSNKFEAVKEWFENVYVSTFKRSYARWIVIVFFIAMTCFSGYSVKYINVGTEELDNLPLDTLSREFVEKYSSEFEATTISRFDLIIQNIDIHNAESRQNLLQCIAEFERAEWSLYSIENWLQQFILYLEYELYDINSLDQSALYRVLQSFLKDDRYEKYQSDIVFDDDINPHIIEATVFTIYGHLDTDYNKRWSLKQESDDILNEYNLHGFMYIDSQYSWYVDIVLLSLIFKNMTYSLIAVGIILFIFIEIRVSLLTLIVVIMIDINLFGWLALCNIGVDRVVFILTIMTVGITVDYIIHMTQFFIVEIGNDVKNEYDTEQKVLKYVMGNIGWSVFKGAFSTFLGGFTLIFTNSIIFSKFFYVIVGIVIVSAAHALIFMPCVSTQFVWLYKQNKIEPATVDEVELGNQVNPKDEKTTNVTQDK